MPTTSPLRTVTLISCRTLAVTVMLVIGVPVLHLEESSRRSARSAAGNDQRAHDHHVLDDNVFADLFGLTVSVLTVMQSRRTVIWSATLRTSFSLCVMMIEVRPCVAELDQKFEQRVGIPFR